jgi:hypothetical protein
VAGNQSSDQDEEDGGDHGRDGLHPFMRKSVRKRIAPVKISCAPSAAAGVAQGLGALFKSSSRCCHAATLSGWPQSA